MEPVICKNADVLLEMSERNIKALIDSINLCESISFNNVQYRKYYINFDSISEDGDLIYQYKEDECTECSVCEHNECKNSKIYIDGISVYADKMNEDGHLASSSCGGCNGFAFHMEFYDDICNFRSYCDDRIVLDEDIIMEIFSLLCMKNKYGNL